MKSSKFSVLFFRYREQEYSNFQLKYLFTLDVIPKFYHETFLTSIGIEVHRGSMDEKAEKNEDMKSSELQPGRELLMRLSLLSTHRACWFICRSVQHHWNTNERCSRSDLKTLTEIKGKKTISLV